LLGGTFFALDGCKLRSNASKECSGTIHELRRKKDTLEKKVKGLLEEQEQRDKREDEDEGGGRPSGGGDRRRQIEKLQKKADRLARWLKGHEAKIGKQGREIKSNVTDNESALMVTSHGVVQGYNGQALVDSKKQVIVHAEVFGEAQDHHLIPPVLDGAKENMEAVGCGEEYFAGKTFTADSNYHDPTNLRKCDEEGWTPISLISVFAGGTHGLESRIQTDLEYLRSLPRLTSNGMRKEMNMFAQMEKSLGSTGRKLSQTESFTDGIGRIEITARL